MEQYDLIVIGGGPAGLAAAWEAYRCGAVKILILERDRELGGILNQCIHNGFGLHYFKEELTGPEYAQRFTALLKKTEVTIKPDTMVLEIAPDKTVHAVNTTDGYLILKARSIVLAMGCRERTRGAIQIPGDRPAGIFTAGTAQRYVNMEGYLVGKRIIILGSGDIGLIMARRMTLEGSKVLACVEIMPYSNGLNRNIVQCLHDYQIPLYLSHTITDIKGKGRVERVTIAKVDEDRLPIPGTEILFDCDTILLSVGLIPENELSRLSGIQIDPHTGGPIVYENMETSIPGIFACGNVVHVHDLVDYVTLESQQAGRSAGKYTGSKPGFPALSVEPGAHITYAIPQRIRKQNVEDKLEIFFRVNGVYQNIQIVVLDKSKILARFKRAYATPGEMQRISLPRKTIEEIEGDNVILQLEEQSND